MSKKVNIIELVVVLTGICAVAALALGGVYEGTKERIAEELRKAELEAVEAVLPKSEKKPEKEVKEISWKNDQGKEVQIKTFIAKVDGQTTASAFAMTEKGFGGVISVMMGVTPENRISGVEILLHKETPGLGAKVEQVEFRQQFVDKSLVDKLAIKKDGGEIDQITGASISSRAVVKAIKSGLKFSQEMLVPTEN